MGNAILDERTDGMGRAIMEETGFCWRCGHIIPDGRGLFCPKPKKCEEQYRRNQDRQIKKGKRAGYGLAGSCH